MTDESSALSLHEPPNEADYDLIHDAVLETQRGRWFLHEYAKRNRYADTSMLLAAIERIETVLRERPALPPPASPFTDLRESLDHARESLDAIKPDGRLRDKSADLAVVATSLKAAIVQMQAAIGPLRDTAYAMREEGVADRFSNSIEGCAGDLIAGCGELDRAATEVAQLLHDRTQTREALAATRAEAPAPGPVIAPAPSIGPMASAAPAASVAPAASIVSTPAAAKPVAPTPPILELAIPGFETAFAADQPATQMWAPELEAITLDPLMPVSDAGIQAPTITREPSELVHAPMAFASEPESAAEPVVLTESAIILSDEPVVARDVGERNIAAEAEAKLPLPDLAAVPTEVAPAEILPEAVVQEPVARAPVAPAVVVPEPVVLEQAAPVVVVPEPLVLEPIARAETPPAAPIATLPEALALLKQPVPARRHPSDALAPIVALSDEEKIALFT